MSKISIIVGTLLTLTAYKTSKIIYKIWPYFNSKVRLSTSVISNSCPKIVIVSGATDGIGL